LLAEGRNDGLEFDLQHADGSVRTVSVSATALKDAEGRFLMSRSVMYDITPLKQEAAARVDSARLEAENRQIHEASRLKSLFLANMSQELRTPLNAVIGMAQLLRSGGVPLDSPQSSALLGQIGDSGRHLLELIDEVLELASAEAGRLEIRPQPEGAGAAGR
jgi:signal transduction histidine kinase